MPYAGGKARTMYGYNLYIQEVKIMSNTRKAKQIRLPPFSETAERRTAPEKVLCADAQSKSKQ